MISRLIKYFSLGSISILLCNCNNNQYENSQKNISFKVDSINSDEGSLMYKSYCLTCHGYTKSGTYYQPSLDSMYELLEKDQLYFSYSIASHEVLISKRDSISFENIQSYIKRKYHPW